MIHLDQTSNYFSVLMAISHELNAQNQDFIPDILKLEPTSASPKKAFLLKARAPRGGAFNKNALSVAKAVNSKSPHTITSGLLFHGVTNHD